MPTFALSCLIRASVQDVFNFHLDTRNLPRVQPPGFAVVKVIMPPESKVGAETRIVVKLLWTLRQHWLVQWAEIQPPRGHPLHAQLTDVMLKGPFPSFHQEHVFMEEGNATRMTDRVTFRPPFGILGWLLLPAIYLQLYGMFAWRHRRTRMLLEKDDSP